MCFIKLEAFKPTYICTFDYVVLQWSVRHLAAASETTMSFAAPIPLFLRFWTPPLDGVSVHVQTILRITPAPFHDADDASYIIFMYYWSNMGKQICPNTAEIFVQYLF